MIPWKGLTLLEKEKKKNNYIKFLLLDDFHLM